MTPRLDPEDPRAPRYWMYESSGVLAPAVLAFINGKELKYGEVVVVRMYLRQWIMSPVWQGPGLDALRSTVEGIQTHADLVKWLADALDEGHDPL